MRCEVWWGGARPLHPHTPYALAAQLRNGKQGAPEVPNWLSHESCTRGRKTARTPGTPGSEGWRAAAHDAPRRPLAGPTMATWSASLPGSSSSLALLASWRFTPLYRLSRSKRCPAKGANAYAPRPPSRTGLTHWKALQNSGHHAVYAVESPNVFSPAGGFGGSGLGGLPPPMPVVAQLPGRNGAEAE
jgi:hypothetical protein